jgi:hypothetical protein
LDFSARQPAPIASNGDEFIAALEVCGFNDWLIRMLHDCRCHKMPTKTFPTQRAVAWLKNLVLPEIDRLARCWVC